MRGTVLVLVLVLGGLMPAGPASTQQYQPWQSPEAAAAADARVQDFVDRLNRLVDEAEKARAADPRFLRDLRDLARGFDRPWRRLLLSDDFGDGDFTRNPAWTVTAGRYWVENGWGLRSALQAAAPQQEQQRLSGRDAAKAIFGQILQQAIDPDGRVGDTQMDAAAVQTAIAITNAFAIEVTLSSWQDRGRLEIGPYQGTPAATARAPGYVLAYVPGDGLELLRVSARGASVIDRRPVPFSLEDKKPHAIEWTRAADGAMRVTIDGRQVLDVVDRAITGPFDGLRIVNRGGDYIFRRIAVSGTGPG